MMNTIISEKSAHISPSPQQQYEEIITQTHNGVTDALESYGDEYQHMKYFIEAADSSDESNLWTGINYINITLSSMNQEFQKLLEKFRVNAKGIMDLLKDFLDFHKKKKISIYKLYDVILKELKKIPDFKNLIPEKLQVSTA